MKRILALLMATLFLFTLATGCGSKSSDSAKDGSENASDGTGSENGGADTSGIKILVTNDDGYDADGIDALVEALRGIDGVKVTVVAPATNQSGKGSAVSGGELRASDVKTKSGYKAKAVEGTPADAIVWAIDQKGISFTPDLVISGINAGANMGPAIELSGTVGAARAAAQRGIPALAASQGPLVAPFDFPAGVIRVLQWFEDNRLAIENGTLQHGNVANLNIPTCPTGSVRGVRNVAPAIDTEGYDLPPNCESTDTDPGSDIAALYLGFAALSQVPAKPAA
jgi:5'-nucleotidase